MESFTPLKIAWQQLMEMVNGDRTQQREGWFPERENNPQPQRIRRFLRQFTPRDNHDRNEQHRRDV